MLLKWRRQWSQANRDAVVKNEGWTVRTRIVACLIALVLALGLAVVVGPGAVSRFKAYAAQNDHARNQQGPRPTAVVTAPVQTTDFPIMRYSTGFLSSPAVVNVASRIRGKILDVVLSENQAVKDIGKFSMARTQSWRDDVRSGMQALLLQNQGKVNGIWASFDGQAYIIDDLLQAQGVKKGQIPLVSVDGGQESFERIADPNSTFMATVSIPFEEMGRKAVDAIQTIVVDKKPKETITSGPYLFMDAVLVDKNNVQQFLKK